jgi:hypothetical protein
MAFVRHPMPDRLTIACNGELDEWLFRYRPLTLVPVDAGC